MSIESRRRAMMATGNSNAIVTQKFVEIHDADWLTDSTGNGQTFINKYFNHGSGLYLATIENNNATGNYKGISVIRSVGTINGVSTELAIARRAGGATSSFYSGTSFYITAGATVTVYFTPKEELEK